MQFISPCTHSSRKLGRLAAFSAASTASLVLCKSELVAQVNRTNFVFHVYVDPVHGDDVLASNSHPGAVPPFNASFTAAKEPLSTHPADATWTNLQHAPYSFRTVTAALTYLPTLPYVVPGSDPERRVERAVIHC
ncbi:MAG TPA: hypothetical protein PKE00_07040 [Planctomycetota bacterium]|nr:hypothetical protein [Planctomycetota bacterium]